MAVSKQNQNESASTSASSQQEHAIASKETLFEGNKIKVELLEPLVRDESVTLQIRLTNVEATEDASDPYVVPKRAVGDLSRSNAKLPLQMSLETSQHRYEIGHAKGDQDDVMSSTLRGESRLDVGETATYFASFGLPDEDTVDVSLKTIGIFKDVKIAK